MKKEIKILTDGRGLFEQEIIDNIMDARGIKNVEEFLNPGVKYISDPFDLYRMDEAVECTINHCKNNANILIWGDVDADGCSSASIVYKILHRSFNLDYLKLYINDGKIHGITEEFLNTNKEKYDLIIIVDSLNTDIEMYKRLKDHTTDIVVLDHHDIKDDIPYDENVILVSSQRNYKNKDLSGAGVCIMFAEALDSELGTLESENLYDLAACGLLADVMSVDEDHMENRAIIKKGFSNPQNAAIKKICGGFGLNSTSILFSVSPLVNAAVRMHKNEEALNVLATEDEKELSKYMKILNKVKKEQTKLTDASMPDIMSQIESQMDEKVIFIVLENNVPSDITGLIGNKVLGMVNRPLFILKEYKDGYGGSMRSTGCGDFRKMCEEIGIGEFSGHGEASGAFIPYDGFNEFSKSIKEKLKDIEFKNEYNVDALISVDDVTNTLVNKVKEIDYITGKGFPRLKFAIEACWFSVDTDGEIDRNYKHTVIKFPGTNFMAIKWNDRSMIEKLDDASMFADEITLIGSLEFSPIYGYGAKMILDDIIIIDETV